jgi:hypothetical protein
MTATESDLEWRLTIIVSSSVFFPSPAVELSVARIDPRTFHRARITVMLIPRPMEHLVHFRRCISSLCVVTLAESDSEAELGSWNRHRQLGSSDAFEHRTSGMGELGKEKSGDDEEGKTPSKPAGQLDCRCRGKIEKPTKTNQEKKET